MIPTTSDRWLQTWRGHKLPLPDFGAKLERNNGAIHHEETARVLSGIERFGARTLIRYTVAEHCVRVAWLVADLGGDVRAQWQAINHEGDEALLGFDPGSPLLAVCPDLEALKWNAHRAYCLRYGIDTDFAPVVKQADGIMLMTERRDVMAPPPEPWHPKLEAIMPLHDVISPWTAEEARVTFLMHWRDLAKQVGYDGEG